MTDNTNTTNRVLLLGVTEAATVLGICRTNVYGLLKTGEVQSEKIGGRRLIPRAALEDFVARLANPS